MFKKTDLGQLVCKVCTSDHCTTGPMPDRTTVQLYFVQRLLVPNEIQVTFCLP